jgi:pre-rRNA-processing protein TSR3
VEALGAAFYICGHPEWAEEVLSHFSYGQSFLDINSSILKRYAACKDEAEMKKTEEAWMARLEKEYSDSRAEGEDGAETDMWKGGNTNHRAPVSSDDEDDDENEGEESDGEVDGIYLGKKPPQNLEEAAEEDKDPFDISDDEDDEEEMAELRRRVLASKPFSNPTDTGQKSAPEKITRPVPLKEDSEVEADSDNGDDDEFDNIIDATPVTDRIGIQAKQRAKASEPLASAVFSRTVVGAPKKW